MKYIIYVEPIAQRHVRIDLCRHRRAFLLARKAVIVHRIFIDMIMELVFLLLNALRLNALKIHISKNVLDHAKRHAMTTFAPKHVSLAVFVTKVISRSFLGNVPNFPIIVSTYFFIFITRLREVSYFLSTSAIKCTGMNEEPNYCAQVCPPQSCDIPYTEYACPERGYHQGCNCINGYLRNATNHCIPSDQCPPPNPCGGLHEVWSENANRQKTCVNKNKETCTEEPEAGCVCDTGYAKDDAGNCIPEDKCDYCPKDEVWVECKMGMCVPETCDQLGYPVACPDLIGPCIDPGCVCKEGYVRNFAGICIPTEQCPSCGGDFNATRGCSNYCGNSCTDYKDYHKVCPEICQYNGCECLNGYVYDDVIEKKCIKAEDCPEPCEDPNAERVSCASHCPATCAKPEPDPCPYAACTKYGCQCKHGYVLSKKNGKCIKITECPANKPCNGDPNAQVKECPDPCPPTCDDPNPNECPIPCYDVGCECRLGYIKENMHSGKCIKSSKCSKAHIKQQ